MILSSVDSSGFRNNPTLKHSWITLFGKIQKKFTQPFLNVELLWNPLESTANDAITYGVARWIVKRKSCFFFFF